MKEVIQDVEEIVKSTASVPNDWETLTDERKDKLSGGIAMCYNHAVICLELLSYYRQIWCGKSILSPEEIEAVKRENGERIIEVTKGLFLLCLSAFEFSMKHALRINACPLEELPKRIKLGGLFSDYLQKKLIDQQEYHQWDGAINIRNAVVHNNGIWEDFEKSIIYPGFSINLIEGAMIQGNLRFFSQLTDWTVSAYIRWSTALMLKAN